MTYEIDQGTAEALSDVWEKAGMPDAVLVYDPKDGTVIVRDRQEVVKGLSERNLHVPKSILTEAPLADPPMLRSFWVAVLLPTGVQYVRVSSMDNGAMA